MKQYAYYPGCSMDSTAVTYKKSFEYIASKIVFTSHTGTHVDCTRHFGEQRPSIEEIDLTKFIGKGKVIDVSASCKEEEPITVEMLKAAGIEAVQEGDRGRGRAPHAA